MQSSSLKLLEEKVLHAVQRIQELKAENDELRRARSGLEEQLAELRDRANRTQRELDASREAAAALAQMEEKRKIIEEKVGGLLDKLDALE